MDTSSLLVMEDSFTVCFHHEKRWSVCVACVSVCLLPTRCLSSTVVYLHPAAAYTHHRCHVDRVWLCVFLCVSSPCSSPALIYYLLFKEPLETSEIERESGICHKLRASRPYCFLTTHSQRVFSIRLFTPTCLWMERKRVQKVWMGKCELLRMTQTAQYCSKQSAVLKCKELKHWLIWVKENKRFYGVFSSTMLAIKILHFASHPLQNKINGLESFIKLKVT